MLAICKAFELPKPVLVIAGVLLLLVLIVYVWHLTAGGGPVFIAAPARRLP